MFGSGWFQKKKECFSKTGLYRILGIFSHFFCVLAGTPHNHSNAKQIRVLCQFMMIIMCGKTIIAIIGLHNDRRSKIEDRRSEIGGRIHNYSGIIRSVSQFSGDSRLILWKRKPSSQIYKSPAIPK